MLIELRMTGGGRSHVRTLLRRNSLLNSEKYRELRRFGRPD